MNWNKTNIEVGGLRLWFTAENYPVFIAEGKPVATVLPKTDLIFKNLFPGMEMAIVEPTRAFIGGKMVTATLGKIFLTKVAVPIVYNVKDLNTVDLVATIAAGYAEQVRRYVQAAANRDKHMHELRLKVAELSAAPLKPMAKPGGYAILYRLEMAQENFNLKEREDHALGALVNGYKKIKTT